VFSLTGFSHILLLPLHHSRLAFSKYAASQETADSGLSSDGANSRQADADSEGDVQWLDGDNSVVEDDIDFITCARDTFIAEEDVDLATSKLLDLLSDKPIEVSRSKTTPSGQSLAILTKPVDWSFAFPS
jgi:hypothetical protein